MDLKRLSPVGETQDRSVCRRKEEADMYEGCGEKKVSNLLVRERVTGNAHTAQNY